MLNILAMSIFVAIWNIPVFNFFSMKGNDSSQEEYIYSIEYEGCPSDLILNIDKYENYLYKSLNVDTLTLNKSIESLVLLDSLIDLNQSKISKELIYSIIVYCGEVIKKETKGEWALFEVKSNDSLDSDYRDVRYFPYIQDGQGKKYDFFGNVYKRFIKTKKRTLYTGIKVLLGKSFKLKVKPFTIPFFPSEDSDEKNDCNYSGQNRVTESNLLKVN